MTIKVITPAKTVNASAKPAECYMFMVDVPVSGRAPSKQ
jgi:3-hydroxyisobutyrate dehydrogenase-like beta-hydroxyacid dehydrogenase